MSWYNKVSGKTRYIFESITQHPFIRELLDGTLDEEIFRFYINQDSLYLAQYKRVLSVVGIKCTHDDDIQFYLDAATGIIHVEEVLHKTFLKDIKLNPEPSPACELYVSYLSRMTANENLEVGMAAVLPCFTIYKDVGDYILENQDSSRDNKYQSWIDTYGGDAFAESVQKAINITDKYAEQANSETLARMEEAYIKSSKLEWMFWDSAYQKEQWKI